MGEASLQIRLLGAPELTWNDAPLSVPSSLKVRSLLAYVIFHHDQRIPRDRLAGLFWPERPDAHARRALSQALWQVRAVLGPAGDRLAAEREDIVFGLRDGDHLDVAEFERLAAGSDLRPLTAAIDIYRADFLESIYDDWALLERERLREFFLQVLERLIALHKQRGHYEQALAYAQRLAAADPLREEVHRELMQLYHLLGRSQAALEQFTALCDLLTKELGVQPTPVTNALYQEIVTALEAGDVPHLPSAPLPPPLLHDISHLPLVGRVGERAALLSALQSAVQGRGGYALIEGDAGVGKSRLVGEVVAGAEWRGFQVGVARATSKITSPYQIVRDALAPLLTPLRVAQLAELVEPVWLSAVASILPTLAEHLPDLGPLAPLEHHEEQRRLWDGLARCLSGLASVTPLLLVLEDIHWADEATLAAFEHLVPSLPANRAFIVLTYRTAEARERAVVWETLDGLDRALPPLRLHLAPFELAETAGLLERALGAAVETGSRFAAMAERLHQEMGGNALFLVESLKSLVEQGDLVLSDGEWIFPPDDVSLPAPTSVQKLIEERLASLSPELRATLELIAVLGENADFNTLTRFNGDVVALLPTLTALGHRGFLFEAESIYRFEHERIGEIVYQAIERERRLMLHRQAGTVLEELYPERVEALAYHFDLGEVWEKALAYTVQAAERASAVHAYPTALDRYQRAVTLVPLAGADDVRRFDLLAAREAILDVLGQRQEQADDLEAMELLVQGDLQRMAEVLRRRVWLLMHTGHYEEAEDVARRALHLAEQENCEAIEAAVLTAMGTLTNWSSKPARAVPYLEQAIQHYLQLGDIKGEADARCNLAGALLGIKAYDDVASELERALSLYTSLKDRLQIIEVLNLLGILYMERGNLADAVACYERALGTAREIGYLYGEARILCNLGNLSYVQGQIDKALALYDEVVPLFEALGERRGEAQVRINRASVHCSFFGGSEVALADAETALAHYREMGEAIGQGQCLSVLGQIALQRDQLVRARTYLEEGLRLVLDAGERWIGAQTYCLLADLSLVEGNPNDALRYVEEAEAICCDLGLEALAIAVMGLRGLVLLALGQPDVALEVSTRAMEQLNPGVEQAYLVPLRHYQVLCALERNEEARVAIEQARDLLFEAIGGLSPEQQRVSLERVPEHRAIVEAWESCQPQRIVVRLPHVDAPTGRPLREEELVSVTWTVAAPEDDAVEGKAERRRHRLLRLLSEADAQSTVPTVMALADVLDVSERTVKRDLSTLRAEGHDVRTRGFRS